MADNLAHLGQLSPIGINEQCEIIHGATRYLAAKQLKWETLLARVFPPESTPGEALRMAVCENTVRTQMTFAEKADVIQRYLEATGLDLKEAAKHLHFTQSEISKCLKIVKVVTPENQKRLLDAGIGWSKAYEYAREEDPVAQTAFIKHGIAKKLTRKQINDHFRQQRIGVTRLEYKTPAGRAVLEIPRGASIEQVTDFVRSFGGDIVKCAKQGLSLPTIAKVLKEQCNVV